MHNHPIFLLVMFVALIGVGAYVFITPSLRNGLPMFAAKQQSVGYAGEYETGLPSADSGGRKVHLSVTNDNKATMTTDYMNGKPAIVDTGDATMESKGVLVITLTKRDGVDLNEVQHISFDVKDDKFILLDPVAAGFGTNGLTLRKL